MVKCWSKIPEAFIHEDAGKSSGKGSEQLDKWERRDAV